MTWIPRLRGHVVVRHIVRHSESHVGDSEHCGIVFRPIIVFECSYILRVASQNRARGGRSVPHAICAPKDPAIIDGLNQEHMIGSLHLLEKRISRSQLSFRVLSVAVSRKPLALF